MEGQTNEIFGNLLNLNSNASSDWNQVEGKAEGQERTQKGVNGQINLKEIPKHRKINGISQIILVKSTGYYKL